MNKYTKTYLGITIVVLIFLLVCLALCYSV